MNMPASSAKLEGRNFTDVLSQNNLPAQSMKTYKSPRVQENNTFEARPGFKVSPLWPPLVPEEGGGDSLPPPREFCAVHFPQSDPYLR